MRLILLVLLIALALRGWEELREIAPWRPVSVDERVRPLAARKIDALHDDLPACQAVLARGDVGFVMLPPRDPPVGQCGYDNAIRLASGEGIVLRRSVILSCPLAVALVIWQRQVVDPAAARHFGARVERVETAGTYNCRRIANSATGSFSEHATGDAIDISAFVLTDGQTVSVLRDWEWDGDRNSEGDVSGNMPARVAFLREVRDGACDLFATTLSPDYNAAHADHFHLDTARRGGFTFCR